MYRIRITPSNALLFNTGNILHHIGTLSEIYHYSITTDNNVQLNNLDINSVCLDTQILFLLSLFSKIFWIDRTKLKNFRLTYFEIYLGIIIQIIFLYKILIKYLEPVKEILSLNKKIYERWYVLLIISIILSILFAEKKKEFYTYFNIYTDALALIPQISILFKEKDSKTISKIYLLCLGIGRFIRFLFWFDVFKKRTNVLLLMLADFLHSIIILGTIYAYHVNSNIDIIPNYNKKTDKGNIL